MTVLPKNILVIDTRIKLIELSAFVYTIRLEQENYENVLLGKCYFEHRVAIMMKEFIEHLTRINGYPEIRYYFAKEKNEEILNLIFFLIIQDFPVNNCTAQRRNMSATDRPSLHKARFLLKN